MTRSSAARQPADRLHDAVLAAAPRLADAERLARGERIAERLNRARAREPIEVCFVELPSNDFALPALPARRVYVAADLLVRDGIVVARVDAEDAFVDLGRAPRARPREVDERLAGFLRERGRLPGGPVALAETTLDEGDLVEVSGVAEDIVVVDGYRNSATVARFRDWPTIRKLPPARGKMPAT